MAQINSFCFPDIPPQISDLLFGEDEKMIIIGVIGKSSFPDCNKMAGFQLLGSYVSLIGESAKDGNIKFYFEKGGSILYVHFETTYDSFIMEEILEKSTKNDDFLDDFISFNSYIRNRFARTLLFAIQVCHLIVFVDTGNTFDVSFLSIFKSLKIIREKYVLKFLPNLLKNSNVGGFMGKEARLCSPRFIFFFEKTIEGYITGDDEFLNKIEFELEDDIYKMLRNEFIITNNSCASLFSIPRNKRFVYFNTDQTIREDPLLEIMKLLNKFIEKPRDEQEEDDQIRPFKGFGKRWSADLKEDTLYQHFKTRSLVGLLKEHVNEALQIGFDDSMAKFRGKSHFVTPSVKSWYETFKILHKIFIENPDNPEFEANDANYKLYLENFQKIMDIDETFFAECCEHGLDTAISHYSEILPHHYSRTLHEEKLIQSLEVLRKYARGSQVLEYENKLKEICENTWLNGKQQCESLSLRGNPCGMPVHTVADNSEHSSGVVSISTCNCGRTQGRREDPYTIKQANYEFYQLIGNICTLCNKIEKRNFPVFEPSSKDFRAADVITEKQFTSSQILSEISGKISDYESINSQPLDASQPSNLSDSFNESIEDEKLEKSSNDDEIDDDEGSVKEIVIKVGETTEKKDKIIARLHSTTEYLPGMVHTSSPIGLLPQFPSWSLVCIGASSVYSHNTGLPEHVQSGFLSGANFLLPWDVQVRLENAAEWAASYEKSRNRKKPQAVKPPPNPDSVFSLKIFIGTEYECPRGHRFLMSSPDKILRGGSGMVVRDSGSKIVFNDMPLYFNCPCRSSKPSVAQLMRIHIVTPKAPCNVILDPKIRPGGKGSLIFVTGLPQPAKLTQSAYWMLRLPYIYQGDDGPILPPSELSSSNLNLHGCLLAGMFGITETE